MNELERRLERAGRILDDASARRADTIVPMARPMPRRRPWVLATAAAVIVALGIGALVLTTRHEPADGPAGTSTVAPSPVTTTSPTTTASPTTTPAPATTSTPVATTVAPTTEAPTTVAPTTQAPTTSTTALAHPAGVQTARPRADLAPAAGDRRAVETWTPIGTFPDEPDLVLTAAWFDVPGLCVAIRRGAEPQVARSACPTIEVGYGVVRLDDGRIAVLVAERGRTGVTLHTTRGDAALGTFAFDAPTFAGGTEVLQLAAAILDPGVDLVGVGAERNDDCPYGDLLASFEARETGPGSIPRTLVSARCTTTAATVDSWASAFVDQPDKVLLDRPAGGSWTWLNEGGAPCDLGSGPGQERAVAACQALGLLRG